MTEQDAAEPLLTISKLELWRGTLQLCQNLDLVVRPGEVHLLAGANGSGKTTLLRMLAGFIPPPGDIGLQSGTAAIWLGGRKMGEDRQADNRQRLHIGHHDSLDGSLSLEKNLLLWAATQGLTAAEPEAVARAISQFGLQAAAKVPLRLLSAGQRQRAGLCKLSLAGIERPLWLLDEPMTALDSESQHHLASILSAHAADGGAVLVSSHGPIGVTPAAILTLGLATNKTTEPLSQKTSSTTPDTSPAKPVAHPLPPLSAPHHKLLSANAPRRRQAKATSMALAVLQAELARAWRHAADTLSSIGFFIIIASLAPLGIGAESQKLAEFAPVTLWTSLLIAGLPQMAGMFASNTADGGNLARLEALGQIPMPMALVVLVKLLAGWLTIGLPMLLIMPLVAIMLGLPLQSMAMLLPAAGLGSMALVMLGGMAAALTIGARLGGVLMVVLVLPLAMPVLIFGTAATTAGNATAPAALQLLLALVMIYLAIMPLMISAALRSALEA